MDKKKVFMVLGLVAFIVIIILVVNKFNKKEIEEIEYIDFISSKYEIKNDRVSVRYTLSGCQESVVKKYYKIENRILNIYYDLESHCGLCASEETVDDFFINKKKYDSVEVFYRYVKRESDCGDVAYKPIIYLYPEKEMDIKVKFKYPEKLLVSYPKYHNEWNVHVDYLGNINYQNKNYYALYYEANNIIDFKVEKDGFIVKNNDISSFLEEKLEILGLNDKEKNEFIIYWLPILEKNKYNYIRFASIEEINNNIPIDIEPKPDTLIRVLMTYKPLDKPISVEEQKLGKVVREGYSVIEWGGTKIN